MASRTSSHENATDTFASSTTAIDPSLTPSPAHYTRPHAQIHNATLKKALKFQRKIESYQTSIGKLTGKLSALLGGGGGSDLPIPFKAGRRKKRKMSAAAKAKLSAAAKLPWKKAKPAGKSRL
jgi:hypothetical protein